MINFPAYLFIRFFIFSFYLVTGRKKKVQSKCLLIHSVEVLLGVSNTYGCLVVEKDDS